MFKYDIHTHTNENSSCATSNGFELAEGYKRAGFTGFVVTNHFLEGNKTQINKDTWKERIDWFFTGYENAKNRGEQLGVDVFFGWEYNYNGADLLTYGIGRRWLKENWDMPSWDIKKYFNEIHKAGGFVCHAHPFREANWIPYIQLFPRETDAIEIFNGSHCVGAYSPEYNNRAKIYAKMYRLIGLAGSDSHGVNNETGKPVRYAANVLKRKVNDINDLVDYGA